MVAGYFGVASPSVRESEFYGMRQKRAVDTREASVPKVYEARACAIDALFDVTPGESVGMLSALKGFGGCVGITFGWFGEGSSNVHHLIRFASQALADRCWDGLVLFSGRCSSPLQGRAFP